MEILNLMFGEFEFSLLDFKLLLCLQSPSYGIDLLESGLSTVEDFIVISHNGDLFIFQFIGVLGYRDWETKKKFKIGRAHV